MASITDHSGRCLYCNYVLRDLPMPRCPECGHHFDPADLRTINLGRQITPAARWALGPAGATMSGGMLFIAALAVWFNRLPVVEQDRSVIDGILLISLGALWLGWPLVRLGISRWAGWSSEWFTSGRRSRAWVGLIIVAVGIAVATRLPRITAFWLSKPSMDHLAHQMMNLRGSSPRDQWLGVIRAREIKDVRGGESFMTTRDATGEAGYIYLPNADPKSAGWSSRRYVGGRWWMWHESH
jgi:hypothetical protein